MSKIIQIAKRNASGLKIMFNDVESIINLSILYAEIKSVFDKKVFVLLYFTDRDTKIMIFYNFYKKKKSPRRSPEVVCVAKREASHIRIIFSRDPQTLVITISRGTCIHGGIVILISFTKKRNKKYEFVFDKKGAF